MLRPGRSRPNSAAAVLRPKRVHVVVDLCDPTDLPMAALVQAGKAFDWLDDEPDLYSDTDLRAAKR